MRKLHKDSVKSKPVAKRKSSFHGKISKHTPCPNTLRSRNVKAERPEWEGTNSSGLEDLQPDRKPSV